MSWPKPVLDSLLELISEGLSNREIAKKLSGLFPNEKFSKDSVKSKRTRLQIFSILFLYLTLFGGAQKKIWKAQMAKHNCFDCRFLLRFTPKEAKRVSAKLAQHGLHGDFFGGCTCKWPGTPFVIRRYLDHPISKGVKSFFDNC